MSRFSECLKFILKWEGGYGNDSLDRGGPTNCGVTQATYDAYRLGKGLGRQPVVGISAPEVADVYWSRYWKPVRGDNLPRGIDLVVFDAAVNHGIKQAAKFLQRAVGVGDDGVIGEVTIEAVISDAASGLTKDNIASIIGQRRAFYENLVARAPGQKKFFNGWMNRLSSLEQEVAKC